MIKKAILLVFLISFALAGLFYALGFRVYQPVFYFFGIIYMWVPGVIALIFAKKEGIKLPLFKFNWTFLIAGVCAGVVSLLSLYFSSFFGGGWNPVFEQYKAGLPLYLGIAFCLGITVNALVAAGEELFWRGYLQEKLEFLGPWKTSLVVGIIWGFWHAPMIAMGYNYPGHPIGGIFMMVLVTLALSPALFYFRKKGQSIAPAAAFHGVFNGFSGLAFLFFVEPNYFLLGNTGLIGILLFAAFSLRLLTSKRKIHHAA